MTRKKKRRIRRFLRRRALILLIILLQIVLLIYITVNGSLISRSLSIAFSLISLLAVLYVLSRRTENGFKLTWIFWILIFPLFGGLFYVLLHSHRSQKSFIKRTGECEERSKPLLRLPLETVKEKELSCMSARKEILYLDRHVGYPAYSRNRVDYFPSGEEMLPSLLSALEGAEKYIFLEFFIIEEGKMWDDILSVLTSKAKEGVLVRVIYDDLGSLFKLPKKYARFLGKRGIECRAFSPLHSLLSLEQNNRDHRKIISIDGKIAYTGGVNIADEYIALEKPFGEWKDCAVRIEGAAAWSFTLMFLQMWELVSKKEENLLDFLPSSFSLDTDGNGLVVPYADRPTDDEGVSEEVYLDMITAAKKYIYITTPYLILDDRMESALLHAAKSGVDVRIITPKKWDKRLVHMVTRSYYEELILGGVGIYEYTPGFIHAKILLADDEIVSIGTANFDYRSLFMHFECGALFTSRETVKAVKEDFLKTLAFSEKINAKGKKHGFFGRIYDAFLRLLAPLF